MGCSPSVLFLSQKSKTIRIDKQEEDCSELATPIAIVIRSTTIIGKHDKESLELLSRKQHALLQSEIKKLKTCWKNSDNE